MKRLVPLAVLSACASPGSPAPAVLGRSDIAIEGRGPLRGGAVFGRCLDQLHVFLTSTTTPKTSITIHPMGAPWTNRHPLLPGRSHKVDDTMRTEPGPLLLDGVLPPDHQFEADSGFVEYSWDTEGRLRGKVEAWFMSRDSTAAGFVRTTRRLVGSFLAYRDASLEPTLVRGVECAR